MMVDIDIGRRIAIQRAAGTLSKSEQSNVITRSNGPSELWATCALPGKCRN
jgi:hypothetical protein